MTLYATYDAPVGLADTADTGDLGARLIDRLTERELDVLHLMARGRSNVAIARQLFLSAKTVESVCCQIFRKLELQPSEQDNRRVLAVLALLRGV